MRRRAESGVSLFSFQDIITGLAGIMILIALLLALDAATTAITSPGLVSSPLSRFAAEQQIERLHQHVRQVSERNRVTAQMLSELASFDADELRRHVSALEEELEVLRQELAANQQELSDRQRQLIMAEERVARLQQDIRQNAESRRRLENSPRRVVVTLPPEPGERQREVLLFEISAANIRWRVLGDAETSETIHERALATRQAAVRQVLRSHPAQRFDVLVLQKPSSFSEDSWIQFFRAAGYRVGSEPLQEERSVMLR